MFRTAILAVLIWNCARAEEPKLASPPARFIIEWNTNRAAHAVVVKGPMGALGRVDRDLERALVVHVDPEDVRSAIGLPSISGKHAVTTDGFEFRPQFPFQAGVRYRATFYPPEGKPVSSVFEIPRPKREPSTEVTEIYPTAEELPENLLKFYVHFSASMSGGHIYDHIRLTDERGRAVELPFLEIDEELWNPEMTRLTLFLDPGRIKRGVKPLEDIGPALAQGNSYTLMIDSSWFDASGTPLKKSFEKRFRVVSPDRAAPNLAEWEITAPKAGTREPLKVTFPDPMDHALALRMIAVKGVNGETHLSDKERVWTFTPEQPWAAGQHKLQVQTTIEDLAGNNIGKPFEVDLFSGVEKRVVRELVERIFEVR